MYNLKKNFGYQMIYRILTVITPLITSPYLARTLGVESLGRYSASYAFAGYFVLFSLLGIENYGNRTIAKYQDDKFMRSETFWNIYIIQFVMSCCSIFTYVIFVNSFITPGLRGIYLLQILCLVDALLNINWFFWGCEQFKITVTRNIVIKILSVISILLFVKGPSDLWIYILIMGLSVVLAEEALWFFLPRYVIQPRVHWSDVQKNIKPVVHLFVPVLALSVFHLMDKTMLNMLSDDANSGYYYNSDKLINIPLQLITGMSAVMLPRIANTLHKDGQSRVMELLRKSSELTLFLTCAVAFGIGAISEKFVPFFFGSGYEPCVVLIRVFVPVLIIKALSDFIRTQYLIPVGRDKLYTIAAFGGAVSNLIVNYALIIRFGALGAVIGTLVAEFVVLLIQAIGAKRELSLLKIVGSNYVYILFGLIMFVIVSLLSTCIHSTGVGAICILILAGAIVYLSCCVIYWWKNVQSIFNKYVVRGKYNG